MYLLKLGNFIGFCHPKVESFFFMRPAWDVEVKNKKHFNKMKQKEWKTTENFSVNYKKGQDKSCYSQHFYLFHVKTSLHQKQIGDKLPDMQKCIKL